VWEVVRTVAAPPSIAVKCGGGGGSSCGRLWCCSYHVVCCVKRSTGHTHAHTTVEHTTAEQTIVSCVVCCCSCCVFVCVTCFSSLQALNTFIDDIFAFIIKMPTLHRLSCLRDDLIFVIYLYQRYACTFSIICM